MSQECLVDPNLYKTISKCFINKKTDDMAEIFVIYSDGARETIWTYNSTRYDFNYQEFIGKTKIESVFYCDRKEPRSIQIL